MSHLLLGSISKFFCVSYSFLNLWICYETQLTNTKIQIQIQRLKLTKQVDWMRQSSAAQRNWFCSKVSIILLWNRLSLKGEKWKNENNKKIPKVSITLARSGTAFKQRWKKNFKKKTKSFHHPATTERTFPLAKVKGLLHTMIWCVLRATFQPGK